MTNEAAPAVDLASTPLKCPQCDNEDKALMAVCVAAWVFAEGWTGKLQYASSSTDLKDPALKNIDLNEITAGADYNFNKSTKVYGFYSLLETKNKNNPATATNGVTDDIKRNFLSLGIEQKF